MNARSYLCAAIVALAALAPGSFAGNLDLSTVPPREGVQLTIYNSEDITLVREVRSLSLKKGANHIQYSWANTLIDPSSVEIRPLEHADEIEVLDATFPGDRPQQLVWNIDSKTEGQVKFQVTYFTSGLSWAADYVLIANKDETELSLDGFVQITNNSGEDYGNAQVRLVVGVINLVEKIQDLARRGLITEQAAADALERRKSEEGLTALGYVAGFAVKDAEAANKPAEIIKEGLSEYFIYTIDGYQSIPNGWSKRLASFHARQVSFDVLYRLRPEQYGARPARFFMLKNDEEHKLGTTPLPDGVMQVFRDNGRDGLSFLGRQSVKYVPVKSDIELNVGADDEVVEELKQMSVERSSFSFDRHQLVDGWDETRLLRYEIRNYKGKPVRMEIRKIIPGDIELSAEDARLFDYQTVEFAREVKPHDKLAWEFKYTQHLGKNARQNTIRVR